MLTLTDDTAFATLTDATGRLAATIRPDTLEAPVVHCPGWTLARLVSHTGRVHQWAASQLRRDEAVQDKPSMTDADALATWYRVQVAALGSALRETPLDEEVQTFWGLRPARFWLRRMAHEATVHAWDAELAVGQPAPIDPSVGADGVDEALLMLFPLRFDAGAMGDRATLHLHATDDGLDGVGEWLVDAGPDGVTTTREHAKGDVAVRAPAAVLDLLVWGRVALDDDRLTLFGDAAILDRFLQATTL